MLEIEVKANCNDLEQLKEKIAANGGKYIKQVSERDTYYQHPARDFKSTDEAFRIRIEDEKYILTYKGPKIGNRTKTRFEKEVRFLDLDGMKEILARLGFNVQDEIIKTRVIYSIDNVEVCLDSVEGLGNFVELEIMGSEQKKGEEKLFGLASKLGLAEFESRSYLELKSEKYRQK